MDNNARVRIQVDDSKIRALKQSAAELYTKLSDQARAQARDLRDANRYIEEQIRLIERRNEAATRSRRAEIEYDKRTGRLVGRSYEAAVRGIDQRTFADQERVRALRGLMDIEFGPRARAMEQFGDISRTAALGGGNVSGGIEEGIRRREIASRRAFAMQENQLRSRYEQGYLTRDQYGRGLRDLRAEQRQDALLVKLLREIADNTKNDSKNSAEELVRRLGITSKDDAAKWIARLEGKRTGGAQDIIRRQEAANILRQQFNVEMTRQDGGGMIGLLGNLRGGIKGALSALGPVGVGLALAGGLGWGAMKRYSSVTSGSRDLAAINGWDLSDLWNASLERGEGGLSLGVSSEEFLSRRLAYQRATGRRYSARATISNFAQQRALGIDNGLYDQMLSTGRFGRGGTSQGAISAIARITQRQFGNLALLPELLNTYQSAAQSVLSSRGDFNQNTIAGVIGGLSQSGIQGPQLNRVVSGLQNIGNNQNPLARGLAYRAAAMVNPNASTWDLGMMIENPLNNTQFLKQYLSQASGLSGGNEVSAKYLLKGLTGLSHADTEALYKAYISGDLEGGLDRIRTTGGGGYEERARNLTSPDEKFNAYKQYGEDFLINVAKEIGQSIVSAMQTEIEAREDQVRKIDEVIEKADNVVTKAFMGVTRANLDNPYIFSK